MPAIKNEREFTNSEGNTVKRHDIETEIRKMLERGEKLENGEPLSQSGDSINLIMDRFKLNKENEEGKRFLSFFN